MGGLGPGLREDFPFPGKCATTVVYPVNLFLRSTTALQNRNHETETSRASE